MAKGNNQNCRCGLRNPLARKEILDGDAMRLKMTEWCERVGGGELSFFEVRGVCPPGGRAANKTVLEPREYFLIHP